MYRIWTFFIVIFIVSCQSNSSSNEFEATVTGVDNGAKVYLSELQKGNRPAVIDTAEVQDGKIILKLPKVNVQTLNVLNIDGANGNLLFINENERIKAELVKDDLQKSTLKGGKANDIFSAYLTKLNEANEKMFTAADHLSLEDINNPDNQRQLQELQQNIDEEMNDYRVHTITENPGLLPSLLMLSDLVQARAVPQPELKKLYDGLSTELKDHFIGKDLKTFIEQSAAFAVGAKAPGFSAKTPEGEELALEDALGKYTLVDFWAAWCTPCRQENPNIVKVYNKYHDKGFNVLGVSLDQDREAWLGAIEKDGLKWPQISNLRYWQDPIAKQYNIKAIPANFLLDAEGRIVSKDLRGPALEKKIAELLGQ